MCKNCGGKQYNNTGYTLLIPADTLCCDISLCEQDLWFISRAPGPGALVDSLPGGLSVPLRFPSLHCLATFAAGAELGLLPGVTVQAVLKALARIIRVGFAWIINLKDYSGVFYPFLRKLYS